MNRDDTKTEDETMPASRHCNHRDMSGESTIEIINGGSWCTSCGAPGGAYEGVTP